MELHPTSTAQSVASITECIDAAEILCRTRKANNGVYGYAAMLLLFSATDAIGHHLMPPNGQDTRLDVLGRPEFGLNLSGTKIEKIKQWYRNPLIHNASIVPDVLLTADDAGEIFDFSATPNRARVIPFHALLRRVWDGLDKTNFDPVRHSLDRNNYHEPPRSLLEDLPIADMGAYASGVVSLPGTGTPPSSGFVTTTPLPPKGK